MLKKIWHKWMGRTKINEDVCRLTTDGEYTWHYWCGSWGIPQCKSKSLSLSWLIILPPYWGLLDYGWCRCSSFLNSTPYWTVSNLVSLLTTTKTSSTSHVTLALMLLLTVWASWYFIGSITSLTYDVSLWGQWIPTRWSRTLSFWNLSSTCIFSWPLLVVLLVLGTLI